MLIFLCSWASFLGSDDWWSPNRLSIIECYCATNQYDLIYHKLTTAQSGRKNILDRDVAVGGYIGDSSFRSLLLNGNLIPNSALFQSVGRFLGKLVILTVLTV